MNFIIYICALYGFIVFMFLSVSANAVEQLVLDTCKIMDPSSTTEDISIYHKNFDTLVETSHSNYKIIIKLAARIEALKRNHQFCLYNSGRTFTLEFKKEAEIDSIYTSVILKKNLKDALRKGCLDNLTVNEKFIFFKVKEGRWIVETPNSNSVTGIKTHLVISLDKGNVFPCGTKLFFIVDPKFKIASFYILKHSSLFQPTSISKDPFLIKEGFFVDANNLKGGIVARPISELRFMDNRSRMLRAASTVSNNIFNPPNNNNLGMLKKPNRTINDLGKRAELLLKMRLQPE